MRPILVIMGPPGAGKTTLGLALAERLDVPFADGDDLHPPANIAKMSAGVPLDDADRAPWLAEVGAVMDRWREAGSGGVVTCSALKHSYRNGLREGRPEMRLVYIEADEATLRSRVSGREGHFMPPSLLADQLRVLEPPAPDERPIAVQAGLPTSEQVALVVATLDADGSGAES